MAPSVYIRPYRRDGRSQAAEELALEGGENDALFSPPTNVLQAKTGFLSSKDVQLVEIPSTGHAVTLGRSHLAFRADMDTWLKGHGF